ncbi:MAG: hypothetical protein M5U07_21490 [Xanthobacteraceae bacterium]|nr:hypothetical protein [Xanthobacteraceae bacterium]
MRVGTIGGSLSARLGASGRFCRRAPGGAARAAESRALVAVAPAAPTETSLAVQGRPLATFLAQLIATDRRLPQTRERRRAEPEDARAAYQAAGRRIPPRRVVADM